MYTIPKGFETLTSKLHPHGYFAVCRDGDRGHLGAIEMRRIDRKREFFKLYFRLATVFGFYSDYEELYIAKDPRLTRIVLRGRAFTEVRSDRFMIGPIGRLDRKWHRYEERAFMLIFNILSECLVYLGDRLDAEPERPCVHIFDDSYIREMEKKVNAKRESIIAAMRALP